MWRWPPIPMASYAKFGMFFQSRLATRATPQGVYTGVHASLVSTGVYQITRHRSLLPLWRCTVRDFS